MHPGRQAGATDPAESGRGEPFASRLAETAVHLLIVSTVMLVALGRVSGPHIAPGPVALTLVLAFLAGALVKLGDDLEDESIQVTLGRVATLAGVACLAGACWTSNELLWLVAGGALGVLAAGKVDRPSAVAGLVLFAGFCAIAARAAPAVPRPELCAIGGGSVLADELLAGLARRPGFPASSGAARFAGWLFRSRFLVSTAVLAAYLVEMIGAAACLAALLVDLGYAAAGAAVARFLAKPPRQSAPAATRRTAKSAGNGPKP